MPEFSAAYTMYSWCSGNISVFGCGVKGGGEGRGERMREGENREGT